MPAAEREPGPVVIEGDLRPSLGGMADAAARVAHPVRRRLQRDPGCRACPAARTMARSATLMARTPEGAAVDVDVAVLASGGDSAVPPGADARRHGDLAVAAGARNRGMLPLQLEGGERRPVLEGGRCPCGGGMAPGAVGLAAAGRSELSGVYIGVARGAGERSAV